MAPDQDIAYQHFFKAIEMLAEHKPSRRQPYDDGDSSIAFLAKFSTQTIPPAAFGDEHLPYSPYYFFGVSNPSCASSLTSMSSCTSVASYDDCDSAPGIHPSSDKVSNGGKSKKACSANPAPVVSHLAEDANSMVSFFGDKRDSYGFKWPTQWICPKELYRFERDYKRTLDYQASKWHAFLAETDNHLPPLCCKLKRYTRKGLPRHLRSKVWMHYSGAQARMDANPGLYRRCLDMGEHNDHEYLSAIQKDVRRMFPDNIHFACSQSRASESDSQNLESKPKVFALQRVLAAFSAHIDCYHPSFATLAAFFLLIVDDEHEAFWLLERVVLDYYPPGAFDNHGISTDQLVLMQLVYDTMPGVWNKISSKRCFWECSSKGQMPPITLVTSHWFMDGFINILPVETVVRIWDCVFIEGYQVLFRAALTIFKMNDRDINNSKDDIQVLRILQNMPRRLIDCNDLLQRVFSRTGISNQVTFRDIERRRTVFRNRQQQVSSPAAVAP